MNETKKVPVFEVYVVIMKPSCLLRVFYRGTWSCMPFTATLTLCSAVREETSDCCGKQASETGGTSRSRGLVLIIYEVLSTPY